MKEPPEHRILLVDDEVIITTQLEEFLTFEGYRVVGIVTSGEEAIEAAQTLAPDIVVMDIMMPGRIDGIAAARKIRDELDIPVLFLTAYADEKLLTRAKPLDPFGYVLKPVQEKQLLIAIELGLYKKKMEDRLLETHQQLTLANHRLQQEINGHRLARNALRRNEVKYRVLVENIPDVIYALDSEGLVTTINPSIGLHYGYKNREIIGRTFTTFIHPADRDETTRTFARAIEQKQVQVRGVQFRILGQDGKNYWVERNAHLSFDDQGRFVQEEGVLRDITVQKQLQDQLIRSERLSAAGRLAASIAHEINSPLQAVTLLLNNLRSDVGQGNDREENIGLIASAFESIKATVRTLIELNRPSKALKQPTQINALIADTVQFIGFQLGRHRIASQLNLADDLPLIMAAPQQLSHVIRHLVNNAMEAILAGPPRTDGPVDTITLSTSADSENIIVTVADTGPGIPEENLNRIFDPFFTQKNPMGIGVGLSVCNGIIKDHRGIITASNASSGGAVFTILLPVENPAAARPNVRI
jgi:PAS domain S-box-containing protein